MSNILPSRSLPFPSRSHSDILEGKLSDFRIRVYRYGLFRLQGTFQKQVPNFGQMKCETLLCLDSGAACDLIWYLLYSCYVFCSRLMYFVILA